jgi:GNAT superfamily N-acetyltransferase
MNEPGRPEPSTAAPIRLRPMTPGDVADSAPLLAQLGYPMDLDELARRVREVLATPDHLLLIAEAGGRLAGLVHVYARPAIENPREAVVQALVVDERWRRAGVGRRLMMAAERWGTDHHCRSVVLSSNTARTPAHVFYTTLGYRLAATSGIFRKPLTAAPPSFVAGLGPAIHEKATE